ncbi:MAG: type II secretion system protein [Verrucomicrobiota bacterium]
MRRSTSKSKAKIRALSLFEMLVIIAVIGSFAAIVTPMVGSYSEQAKKTVSRQNAKRIERLSQSLAALGVAHVIPESMGGVEATARLLREGVIIPEGSLAGQKFILPGLADEEIERASEFLYIRYDFNELRLVYYDEDPEDLKTMKSVRSASGLCLHWVISTPIGMR